MADTIRTTSALQTALADNTSNAITAQNVRDFLVSTPNRLDDQTPPPRTEIAVTTTATATINSAHKCTGGGYALTLPAVSGNTGNKIWVRIDETATGLVTVTGHSAETINGSNTRIMHAGESCELYCDGTEWKKLSGRTIPYACSMSLSSGFSLTSSSWTLVTLDTADLDPFGMADTSGHKINIPRGGTYEVSGGAGIAGDGTGGSGVAGGCQWCISAAQKNTVTPGSGRVVESIGSAPAGGYCLAPFVRPVGLSAGDYLDLATNVNGSGAFVYSGSFGCLLSVLEIPSW